MFRSSLAGAGSRIVVCGCGFGEGSERIWRGGVVGKAGSGVWVYVAGVDGSGWFSGDSGWAGVFVGEESFVSRGFVAVSGERVVVVSGDVLGCGGEGVVSVLGWVGMDRGEGNWMVTSVLVYTLLVGIADLLATRWTKSKQRTTRFC